MLTKLGAKKGYKYGLSHLTALSLALLIESSDNSQVARGSLLWYHERIIFEYFCLISIVGGCFCLADFDRAFVVFVFEERTARHGEIRVIIKGKWFDLYKNAPSSGSAKRQPNPG